MRPVGCEETDLCELFGKRDLHRCCASIAPAMRETARLTAEIRRNARIHDRIARKYEKTHGEIFNPVEQRRVRERLAVAVASIRTTPPFTALDFGAGTGNLSRHLIALGIRTTAADVS